MTNLAVCSRATSVYQCVYTGEMLVSQLMHCPVAHARPTMFNIPPVHNSMINV